MREQNRDSAFFHGVDSSNGNQLILIAADCKHYPAAWKWAQRYGGSDVVTNAVDFHLPGESINCGRRNEFVLQLCALFFLLLEFVLICRLQIRSILII
jgi:hypothetical protein